jgi:hypothetical protein
MEKNVELETYKNENVPEIFVPFDYDENEIILLEYKPDN